MMEDEALIARVSSGLALCGTYVGGSSELIGSRRALKGLLRPPEACKFKFPDLPHKMESLLFSSIQASEEFSNAVQNSGWSVALNVSTGNLFPISVTTSVGGSKFNEKETEATYEQKTSEACHLQYWYFPKATFSLPRNQMQLTEEALDDMRSICTIDQARRFLNDYNSHISTGTYYLGGILLKGVTMKANSETTYKSMLAKVTTKANLKAEASYLAVKCGMEFVYLNHVGSSSSTASSRQQATVKAVHMALGPSTDDEEEFEWRLGDRSTWSVIDIRDEGELLPIWKIPSVKGVGDLQLACGLLREAWLDTFYKIEVPSNSRLYRMLRESYLESRTHEVNRLLNLSLSSEMSSEIYHILSDLWVAASKKTPMEDRAAWDERLRLYRDYNFQNLLNMIAESTDLDMSEAKALIVQGILSTEMRQVLENEHVPLSASIQNLLRQSKEIKEGLPTFERISATQLLERLREFQTAAPINMLNPVEQAVKACLREHSAESEAVKNVIEQHGFAESGNFIGQILKKDTVESIILDLADKFETPVPGSSALRLQEADNPVVKVPAYNTSPTDVYTYSGNFLVDRPNTSSCEDPCTRMIDRIRHRIQPFTEISATSQNDSEIMNEDNIDNDDDITFGSDSSSCIHETLPDGIVSSNHSPVYSPLEILVRLLIRSDVLAQIAIFQVLLEERFAIPIVIPLDGPLPTNEGGTGFGHLVEALGFVKVKLANQEILSIAENTKLLRVVFVSDREVVSQRQITEMACDVMNCQFPNYDFDFRRNIGSPFPTIMELGVGFLSNKEPPRHVPCLVFCVSGDHNKLGSVLEKIADIVVLETEPEAKPDVPSWSTGLIALSWSTDSKRGRKSRNKFRQVWGSFKQVSHEISTFLVRAWSEQLKGSNGVRATLDECLKSVAPLNGKTLNSKSVVELDTIHFDRARDSFSLQKCYSEEAQHYFEALQNKGMKTTLDRKIRKCKERRAREAEGISRLPIVKHFVKLLLESDTVKRNTDIWHFQLTIDQKLHLTLEEASRKENDAFDEYQKNPGKEVMKDRYYHAKEEHVDQMLGLEHLWRELSHIFVADPVRQEHLPQLAAYHLMDGFPLEILDGDAATFHKPWVDKVLIKLDSALRAILGRNPKVFVLSVVGLQSSGKSTLLNIMFGAKLKASAGMCTRGVFLQLVKSEWSGFDYVLILDTMGLKAPEYFGRKGAVAQDNRLATFAILPADACVIMVANEEDNGLKEVLPMVMLAFKGSALAEKTSGRMRAKLFFVYRSVDQNDIKKLQNNQKKLSVDLQDASKAVGSLSISGTSNRASAWPEGVSPLEDFKINPKDEKHSDVKYFGNLKKDTTPPGDVPVWEYGSKVEELRQYIHERVLNGDRWEAHGLMKWKDHLGMVWESIADADFDLSFLNRIERANFHELQTRLATCRQNVGKKWQDEFELLSGTAGAEAAANDQSSTNEYAILWRDLESKVEDTAKTVEEEVFKILKVKKYQNWETTEKDGWCRFCEDNERYWQERLRNWIAGALRFENLLREYTIKMEVEISHVRKRDNPKCGQATMMEDFESIFKRVLQDAADKHPAMASKVKGMIHEKYLNHAEIGKRYKFEADTVDKSLRIKCTEILRKYLEKLPKLRFPWREESTTPEEVLSRKLVERLKSRLPDTKQYSDHLVDEMMQYTEDLVEGSPISLGQSMHSLVKALLTEEMTKIQEDWDKRHNVCKKLEAQRKYFWGRFESHARKEDGTKMLSMAFCHALCEEDQLVHAFKALLATKVANNLQPEQWVCNWKVMRAHLDLHLIELIENNKTEEVIDYVSDGQAHYRSVMEKLIQREIANQLNLDADLWTNLISLIYDATTTAAVKAMSNLQKPQTFQRSVIKSLRALLLPELAKSVSINVSEDLCRLSGNDIDFYEIRNQVSEKMNNIHFDKASFTKHHDIVDMVRKKMVESNTEGTRPRCDEACPRCHLTCFRPSNHPGKHNTLHQPQGLSWVKQEDTSELSWESCSKSVELDYLMEGTGLPGPVPYKDFEKYFPSWTLPSEGLGTVEVREYIFAHFQAELVKVHPGFKACSNIPPEFMHNLKDLRLKLSNDIESCTGLSYIPL